MTQPVAIFERDECGAQYINITPPTEVDQLRARLAEAVNTCGVALSQRDAAESRLAEVERHLSENEHDPYREQLVADLEKERDEWKAAHTARFKMYVQERADGHMWKAQIEALEKRHAALRDALKHVARREPACTPCNYEGYDTDTHLRELVREALAADEAR